MAVVRRDPTGRSDKKKNRAAEPEEVPDKLNLSLPDEETEPIDDLGQAMILLFGEKKIGKTELASRFGKAFFMATEIGYKGLRIFKRDINTWKEARGYVKMLRKDKSFNTVVIDTADLLYELCFAYVCQKLVIQHPNEEDYGKGWHDIKKEFESLIVDIAKTGKGVIIISHAQEKEVKLRDGSTYDRVMPTMSKQARGVIEGMVDIWACYQYDGRRRVLTIEGDDHVSAGHRFGERFRTPDGRRIRQISMGRSAKQGYANLVAAWNNEYEPSHTSDVIEEPKHKKTLKLKRA